MRRLQVMVDDNFHYMDESERVAHVSFDTLDAAIEACRRIVDRDFHDLHKPGMSADELYSQYVFFGADPFIVSDGGGGGVPFSARDYARERTRLMTSMTQ